MAMRKIQRAKKELLSLCNELNDLDVALSASPSSPVTQAKREQVKVKNRRDWTQHKARAAQVRARGRRVEKGEKNTKYFLNLENSTANGKKSLTA